MPYFSRDTVPFQDKSHLMYNVLTTVYVHVCFSGIAALVWWQTRVSRKNVDLQDVQAGDSFDYNEPLGHPSYFSMYWYRMWGGNMWRWDLSDTKLYNPSLELQFVTGATYNSSPELHPSTGDTPDHWSYSPSLELHPIIVVDTPDHWSCCTEQHITGSTPHHWSYNSSMELHPITGASPQHWSDNLLLEKHLQ